MSTASLTSPVSPVQHKDNRSADRAFKRDKDHREKWSMGLRPSGGCFLNFKHDGLYNTDLVAGGSEAQRAKVRPQKQWSQIETPVKSRPNRQPKINSLHYNEMGASSNITRKVDGLVESTSPDTMSKSLLELLPQHYNNTASAIQVMGDEGILYGYSKSSSPNARGREVDLGGLVERAEQKWAAEQTEKMVRGEYEFLDLSGEAVKNKKGKKGSRSPKNRAMKNDSIATPVDEDDGFELI